MAALTFDDLLEPSEPSRPASRALTFDDLIEAPAARQMDGAGDIGGGIVSGLAKGVVSIPGMVADIGGLAQTGLEHAQAFVQGRPYEDVHAERAKQYAVSPETLAKGGSAALRSYLPEILRYDPQTALGKGAETVASFAPGAGVLGGLNSGRAAAATVAAPAAGTLAAQGANNVLGIEGTPAALLEGAGALAGGIGGMAALRPRSPSATLSRAAGELEPAVYAEAQTLMDQAAGMGVRLTADEAIQQVTGNATRLSELRRVVENSKGGGDVLKPLMAERPGQLQRAADGAMDAIAPSPLDPTRTGIRTQEASTGALLDAERQRSAATRPYYEAAASERVPVNEMEGLLSSIDKMAAGDKTGLVANKLYELRNLLTERPGTPAVPGTPATRTPVTGLDGRVIRYEMQGGVPDVPEVPRLPLTDIDNLDRVRKAVRDRIDAPQIGADALTKEQAGALSGKLGELREAMVDASPNFAAGKQLHAQITKDIIEPLQRGPLGGMAAAETAGAQAKALLPAQPLPGAEKQVAEAVRKVAARDPEAAQSLIRGHVRSAWDEATQNLASGENQFGGAKYASIIAGNGQQAVNLEAAVRALPTGDQTWAGFRRFLDVMEATGKRPQVGSATAFNQEIQRELKQGGVVGDAVQAARTGGTSLIKRFNEFKEQLDMGRNTTQIANLLTRPDAARVLGQLAKLPAKSTKADILALRLTYMGRAGGARED